MSLVDKFSRFKRLKDCQNDPNLTANGKANEITSQVNITINTTLSYGASSHQNDIKLA